MMCRIDADSNEPWDTGEHEAVSQSEIGLP